MKKINWVHSQKWLLKREFWEHKGAAFWTPAVISLITLVLSIVGSVVSILYLTGQPRTGIQIDGDGSLMAISWAALTPFAIAWVFISFLYSIGALYEDRKDKSALFWSSLPVSDTHVVFSKAVFVLLVGPALALAFATITSIALVLCAQLIGAIVDVKAPSLMSIDFWSGLASFWMFLPIYALWALPFVAWCLMISAWAKSKPFLWAVGIPLGFAASMGILFGFEWFIRTGVLLMERVMAPLGYFHHISTGASEGLLSLYGQALLAPSLWIGVILGGLMLSLTIKFRKKCAEL